MRRMLIGTAVLALAGVANANELLNPGFEDPAYGAGSGNNIGASLSNWSNDLGSNDGFNVINNADAHSGAQYLDLTGTAATATYIYQSFTVSALSTVDFGGYFSPRDGKTGGGSTAIYDSTNAVSLLTSSYVSATGSSAPWVLSENTAAPILTPGTYTFRAFVDDPANVDDVFVNLTPASTPEPTSIALLGVGGLGLLARRRRGA